MSSSVLVVPKYPDLIQTRPRRRGVKLRSNEIASALRSAEVQYPLILTLREAAAIARVSTSTLKRWASEGRFVQSAKRGKPLLFWRDRFIAEVMR